MKIVKLKFIQINVHSYGVFGNVADEWFYRTFRDMVSDMGVVPSSVVEIAVDPMEQKNANPTGPRAEPSARPQPIKAWL
nr:hypothetical protein Iba_chr15dCG7420 [Ipomoea batatas]